MRVPFIYIVFIAVFLLLIIYAIYEEPAVVGNFKKVFIESVPEVISSSQPTQPLQQQSQQQSSQQLREEPRTQQTLIEDGDAVYVQGAGLVAKKSNEGITYYHQDYLSSNRFSTDSSGKLSGKSTYYPYGVVLDEAGAVSSYKFTGKEKDDDLYYYGARYYDPSTARFVSTDPVFNPTTSSYAYANDNPLRFVDPSGAQTESTDDIPELRSAPIDENDIVPDGPYGLLLPNQMYRSEYEKIMKEEREYSLSEQMGARAHQLVTDTMKYRGARFIRDGRVYGLTEAEAPGTKAVSCIDIWNLVGPKFIPGAPVLPSADKAIEYLVKERGWELVLIFTNPTREPVLYDRALKGRYAMDQAIYPVDIPVSHMIVGNDLYSEETREKFEAIPYGMISYNKGFHSAALVYGQSVEIHIGATPENTINAVDFVYRGARLRSVTAVAIPPGYWIE